MGHLETRNHKTTHRHWDKRTNIWFLGFRATNTYCTTTKTFFTLCQSKPFSHCMPNSIKNLQNIRVNQPSKEISKVGWPYLWILQAFYVGVQVELDTLSSTGECYTTNQQHDEHDKWKGGCDVDHLRKITDREGIVHIMGKKYWCGNGHITEELMLMLVSLSKICLCFTFYV